MMTGPPRPGIIAGTSSGACHARLLPLALLLLTAPALAAPVPKDGGKAEQERLWQQLAGDSSPAFTEAVCRFLTHPDDAVKLFDTKLRPLVLHRKDAEKLIERLGSAKEVEWKAAFDELTYFDPRLAMPLDECWTLAKTDDQKRRLAWVLTTELIEGSEDSLFELQPPQGGKPRRDFILRKGPGAKARQPRYTAVGVSKDLKEMQSNSVIPSVWVSATLAIQLLARMDTPSGWEVIERMAGGRAEAVPTIQARVTLVMKKGKHPQRPNAVEVLADRVGRDWDSLRSGTDRSRQTQAIAAFVLDQPAESVRFFQSELKPLKLDRKRADELVKQLFSEKETEWQAAMAEMKSFDPRLALPFARIWEAADTPDKRVRVKMWLTDWSDPHDRFRDYTYALPPGPDRPGTLRPTTRDGVAAADLPVGFENRDKYSVQEQVSDLRIWEREEWAVHILNAIGTNDAVAVIKDMATGHPDAGPTKAAKGVLKRRGVK